MTEGVRTLAESVESMVKDTLEGLPHVQQRQKTSDAFQAVLKRGMMIGLPALVRSYQKGLSYAGRFSPFPKSFGPNWKRFGTIDFNVNCADDYVVLHELGHMVVELTRGSTPPGRDCEHLADGAAFMLAYLYNVVISDNAQRRIVVEPGGKIKPAPEPKVKGPSLEKRLKDWWSSHWRKRMPASTSQRLTLGHIENTSIIAIELLGAVEGEYEYKIGDKVVASLISGHWFWASDWDPYENDADCEMVRAKLREHDFNLARDATNAYACKMALQLIEELKNE